MEKAMFRNAIAAMIALLMMKQGRVSFYVEKETGAVSSCVASSERAVALQFLGTFLS